MRALAKLIANITSCQDTHHWANCECMTLQEVQPHFLFMTYKLFCHVRDTTFKYNDILDYYFRKMGIRAKE